MQVFGPSASERMLKYVPTNVHTDLSQLTEGDKKALVILADVSDLITKLFYQQAWSGAPLLREKLADNALNGNEEDQAIYDMFEIYRGPWDRSMENKPFFEGIGPKPKGANMYPADMTVTEFNDWVKTLSVKDAKRARGYYDLIQRRNGKLCLVKYSEAYKEQLQSLAKMMREASEQVSDPSLAKFLRMRGDAFESNEYSESELAWLKISYKSTLEACVGPYETYEDELFSAKAFFRSVIHVRDFKGSQELSKFTQCLELIESHLPIPDEYRNTKLVPPPIAVVNQVYHGGDTAAPVSTAYNLPNDEDIIKQAGSKLILIRNLQEGQYHAIDVPIARIILSSEDFEHISFEALFTGVVLHEVAHSNGPHWTVDGQDTVRGRLQELHTAYEEAKADITSMFAANLLVKKGIIDNMTLRQLYISFLASAFRSIRFGIEEAHGLGKIIQLNYLMEKGGITHEAGKFGIDMVNFTQAVSDLTSDIMILQGNGDKQRALEFKDQYGHMSLTIKDALNSIKSVPYDIIPIWADIDDLRSK
ncbi:hypothetical protein H4R24_004105 [Coemansia sp. RSA 988]|nr:hypothetical protein H4R24_004105 [Coemansia sp. RSA 988]